MGTDSRYRLATSCLDLLEISHLPQTKRLRLQLLLLEVKISLLKREPLETLCGSASEQTDFPEVLLQVEQMCRNHSAEGAYQQVVEDLTELVEDLSRSHMAP